LAHQEKANPTGNRIAVACAILLTIGLQPAVRHGHEVSFFAVLFCFAAGQKASLDFNLTKMQG